MDHCFLTVINGGGPLCAVQRLKAKCDEALSNFAFNFHLRYYTKEAKKAAAAAAKARRCRLTLSDPR